MTYDFVEAGNKQEFIKEVNKRLADGWRLHGAAILTSSSAGGGQEPYLYYGQAMVKAEPGEWKVSPLNL